MHVTQVHSVTSENQFHCTWLYSLCVGEIRRCFFLVKLHAFKSSSIFFFLFVDVCWLDDKVKILCGKFSYRLQKTALDGIDLLEIGPVNACKKAFKIDEATCMWKTFKSDCAVKGQEKGERKF